MQTLVGEPMTPTPATTPTTEDSTVAARITRFVETDYGKVTAAVALATGDRDAAEDGVQDALVKIVAAHHEPDSLAAWVTVVATNEVRQRHRRSRSEDRAAGRLDEPDVPEPEAAAERTDVRTAISRLPERQREIVLLHYYLDTSVADIATVMEITTGTVKTQLHRARASLGTALGSRQEDAS
jgi:RNA polymerase sigma-70 factor, ECF subfamily